MSSTPTVTKTPVQKVFRVVMAVAVVVLFIGLWQDFTHETRPEWVKALSFIMCLLLGAQFLIDPAPHLKAPAARWLGVFLLVVGALGALYRFI